MHQQSTQHKQAIVKKEPEEEQADMMQGMEAATSSSALVKTQLYQLSDLDGTGDLYKGEFIVVTKLSGRETVKHGLGTICYANGSIYEGMWKNGVREGYGRLIHPTGDMYEGEWSNDKANGQGVFENLEGYSYRGEWHDDC